MDVRRGPGSNQHAVKPPLPVRDAAAGSATTVVSAMVDPMADDSPTVRRLPDAAAFLTSTDGWRRRPPLPDPIPSVWFHAGSDQFDPDRDGPVHVGTWEQAQARAESLRRMGRDATLHRFELAGPVYDEVVTDEWANFAAHGHECEQMRECKEQLAAIRDWEPDEDAAVFDEDDPYAGLDVDAEVSVAQDLFEAAGLLYVNEVEGVTVDEGPLVSLVVPSASFLRPI